MGLWGKIKNVLFEDDEEIVEEMPVYTKEDVEEKKEVEVKKEPIVEEKPIEVSDHPTFNNVKRDIYMPFEDDVLEEIAVPEDKTAMPKPTPEVVKPPVEEKKSPFLSFDEDEFERLNSRVSRNENREEKRSDDANMARRANNNFSSTTTPTGEEKSINSGTIVTGKKPFTPSPVISPVYGILGENYKKDDIVDRKDGMKREKVVKPVIAHVVTEEEVQQKKEEEAKKEEPIKVNIDSVRQKAYGSLNKMEEEAQKEIEEDTTVREKPIEPRKEEKVEVKKEEKIVPEVKEEVSVEDQIENEEPLDVTKILEDDAKIDEIQNEAISKKEVEVEKVEKKPRKLDEIEKTSTLQILDDIEKELNSIKPITKTREEEEDIEEIEEIPEPEPKTEKEKLESNDTLENDLFNLIDSMYEEGEEEEENG